MAIANYILDQRPITPSVDLNVVQNAANQIQQGSEKALEYESDLKTAIAELDLNEAEAGFRQQLLNELENAADTGSSVPYYSLPQLIKSKGNIFGSPALIGRLRAQQAHKQFEAQIDANNQINDNVKRYAKAMNPYHYEDKVDENGNVIGGSEWKPNFTPVKSMDYNEMLKIAAQYISPESGNIQNISFIDANGNPTNNPTDAIAVYSVENQQWERISSDKLRDGVRAARLANPEFDASLQQDWTVYNWMYDNGELEGNPIVNETGGKKTKEQYISDIIDPFIRAKESYNFQSSKSYNDAAFKYINERNKQDDQLYGEDVSLFSPNLKSTDVVESHSRKVIDDSAQKAMNVVSAVNADIKKQILDLEDVDLSGLDIRDLKSLQTILDKTSIDNREKDIIVKNFKRLYNQYHNEFERYNELLNDETEESAAYYVIQSMLSGTKISDDAIASNKYIKPYADDLNNIINTMYNGKDNISYLTKNAKQYDRLVEFLGGEDAMNKLGYKVTKVRGRYVISLPNDNSGQLYNFMVAASNAHNESSWWYRQWEGIKAGITKGEDGFYRNNDIDNKKDTDYEPLTASGLLSLPGTIIRQTIGDIKYRNAVNIGHGKANIGENLYLNFPSRDGFGDVFTAIPALLNSYGKAIGINPASPESYVHRTFGIFMDRLNRDAEQLNTAAEKIINTKATNDTPEINAARKAILSTDNTQVQNVYKNKIEQYANILDNLSSSSSLLDATVYMLDKDNKMDVVDSNTKNLIVKALSDPDNKKTFTTIYDFWNGEVNTACVINFKDKEGNPITNDKEPLRFTTNKFIENDELKELNNSINFKSASELYRNGVNNANTNIGTYEDEQGNLCNIYITPPYRYGDETIRSIINSKGNKIDDISEDAAIKLYSSYLSLLNITSNPNIASEEVVNALINFKKNPLNQLLYGDETMDSMFKIMLGL